MPPRNKELRPPAELVEAINAAEDMVAPEGLGEVLAGQFSADTPRTVRNRLHHEVPQAREGTGAHDVALHARGGTMETVDKKERAMMFDAVRREQEAGPLKYNRQHPGGGRAGQGDGNLSSSQSIMSDARRNQGLRPMHHHHHRPGDM